MADFSGKKKQILKEVDDLMPGLFQMSRQMYSQPELALEEFQASSLMKTFLRNEGFYIEEGVAGLPTAFRARYGKPSSRPAIGLLAEMDALPEIGHGCGHNIGGSASVGAAVALARVMDSRKGRIEVLGTPAEEIGLGKIRMVEAGVFKGLDCAMMVHCSSKRTVIKGFLGMVKLEMTFLGKSAHAAAYPEEGINALDALVLAYTSIAALRQQLPEKVRVHGIITDGGQVPNIIPDRTTATFLVRGTRVEEIEDTYRRVKECARGAAKASGCRVRFKEDRTNIMPFNVNRSLAEIYRSQLSFLGLEESGEPEDEHLGSSDISLVSWVVPAIHPHVILGNKKYKIHTREFAEETVKPAGRAAILEGASCLALTAWEIISRPSNVKGIRSEFQRARRMAHR